MTYSTNPDNITSYILTRDNNKNVVEVSWEVKPRPILDALMTLIGKEERSEHVYCLNQGNWVDKRSLELVGLNEYVIIRDVISGKIW